MSDDDFKTVVGTAIILAVIGVIALVRRSNQGAHVAERPFVQGSSAHLPAEELSGLAYDPTPHQWHNVYHGNRLDDALEDLRNPH
jgi:hypothetical protein